MNKNIENYKYNDDTYIYLGVAYENNGRSGFGKRGRNTWSKNHRKTRPAVRPPKISWEKGSPDTNGRKKQGGEIKCQYTQKK